MTEMEGLQSLKSAMEENGLLNELFPDPLAAIEGDCESCEQSCKQSCKLSCSTNCKNGNSSAA